MTKILILLIGLALTGAAQAQIKCWTGANGKRECGDSPPPGAKLQTPRGAPMPEEAPRPATEAKKATAAPAPQPESQRAADSSRTRKPKPIGDLSECERAKEKLAEMGGGGRSQRTDAVRARALYANNCVG